VVRANRTDVPSGAAAERFRELLRDGASVRDALAGARDFGLPGTTRVTPGTQLGDPPSVPPAIVPGENPPGCCDPSPPRSIDDTPDPPAPPGPLAPVREIVGDVGGGVVPESAGVGDVGARLAP
jgi:hypothetical protein